MILSVSHTLPFPVLVELGKEMMGSFASVLRASNSSLITGKPHADFLLALMLGPMDGCSNIQ